MAEESRESIWARCEGSSPTDQRNRRRLMVVSVAWALAFCGATLVIRKEAIAAGPLLWVMAAVPALLGVAVMVTYGRFLRQTDELQRLIQLEALALGFGGGVFAIYAYWIFQQIGAPAIDLVDCTLVMLALYVLGIVLGRRRYR